MTETGSMAMMSRMIADNVLSENQAVGKVIEILRKESENRNPHNETKFSDQYFNTSYSNSYTSLAVVYI